MSHRNHREVRMFITFDDEVNICVSKCQNCKCTKYCPLKRIGEAFSNAMKQNNIQQIILRLLGSDDRKKYISFQEQFQSVLVCMQEDISGKFLIVKVLIFFFPSEIQWLFELQESMWTENACSLVLLLISSKICKSELYFLQYGQLQ